jgi:hypothetical protein
MILATFIDPSSAPANANEQQNARMVKSAFVQVIVPTPAQFRKNPSLALPLTVPVRLRSSEEYVSGVTLQEHRNAVDAQNEGLDSTDNHIRSINKPVVVE